MRYVKDAMVGVLLVLLVPVLLVLFPVSLFVLALSRVFWGIERRSYKGAWSRSWAVRSPTPEKREPISSARWSAAST